MAEIRDAHGPGFLLHSQDSPILVDLAEAREIRRVSTYSNRSSASGDSNPDRNTLTVNPFLGTDEEPSTPMSVRPFTPSETFSFPKPPTLSRSISNAASLASPTTANPFSDPPGLDIETVRRPFEPTLHDEIQVSVGERVRVSKVFDDGWVLIEKFPMEEPGKGKAKQIQGLIPVDCLRAENQDLPEFLASKRVQRSASINCAVAV